MDNIRIAILSAYDIVCAYMDNQAPKALHYFDDELHEYLKGAANTYSFKANARHEDSAFLAEGNKLAFRWRMRDYYLNIMSVRRDEYTVEVTAYSLNFELLNEQKDPYKSQIASSFESYLRIFDPERVINLGINEVSDKMISHDWEGTDTMLARLYSLATVFDAELEFIPNLNPDHSLSNILMNVYQKHSDTAQGVGTDNRGLVLRFGKEVSGVTKTTDIKSLYTAIRPTGKDGLTIASLSKTEYDADGNVEFQSPAGKINIYAVQARDRFPSTLMAKSTERYIAQVWSYDTDNVNVLYGQALAELKKNCVPQIKYEVDGYFDTNIGDTVTIADEDFNPPLYLEARVTEQIRSFTNPALNKTVFDNFKELQSQIDPSLLAAMNALIEANKTYTCTILTDNGIVFKNGQGTTTLTASVMDVGKDMTDSLTIQWEKDGAYLSAGKSITVNAIDVAEKAVYRFEALDSAGEAKCFAEVTIADVSDGDDGPPGVAGADGRGITGTEITYQASANGTTVPTGIWTSSIPAVPAGQYLWTRVIYTYSDSTTSTAYSVSKMGETGAQGNPTGVTVSATEPTEKYTGMLWQHTGVVPGLINNATYRWTGASWVLYYFSAANVKVDSLDAFSANLGTVNAGTINGVDINGSKITQSFNNVVYDSQTGSKMTGQTSMHDYLLDCTYNLLNSSGAKVGSGEWSIHPLSFGLTTRGSNGAISGQVSLSGAGLMLRNSVKTISITPDTYKKIQCGRTGLIAVAGGGYTDTAISFSGFSGIPYIFLTFQAGTQNTKYLGLACMDNVTTTSANIRITNAGTAQYSVFVNWMAVL